MKAVVAGAAVSSANQLMVFDTSDAEIWIATEYNYPNHDYFGGFPAFYAY